jgi:O-acetylhomoserine/O-acetylserine sulfhydrylase-like pyridoxal-dependent enzyme
MTARKMYGRAHNPPAAIVKARIAEMDNGDGRKA